MKGHWISSRTYLAHGYLHEEIGYPVKGEEERGLKHSDGPNLQMTIAARRPKFSLRRSGVTSRDFSLTTRGTNPA